MLEQGLGVFVDYCPPVEEVEEVLGRSCGLTLPDQFVETLPEPIHIARSYLYKETGVILADFP
jgi:hypothetical protein